MFSTVTSAVLLQSLSEADGDAAWRRLCDRYQTVMTAFACRAGLQEDDARDVVQETLTGLLESVRNGQFDPRQGRLRSWFRGIVINKIHEARRRLAQREVQIVDPSTSTGFMNRIPDDGELTDIFDQEWERGIMAECLREVRRHVDAPTFQAFELYAMEEWPADKVAEHLGISRNAVYISKSRVLSHLRQIQQKITEIW